MTRTPVSFIATDDADAAEAFYSGVLGLSLTEKSPFALAYRDGTHGLRIQIVQNLPPAPYTAHGWVIDDISGEIERLVSQGVTFLIFDHLPQDANGIWTTPDGHKIAWFNDPSGNILSLTEQAVS